MKRNFKLYTLVLSVLILAFTSVGVLAQDYVKKQDVDEQPIYRLYNVKTSEHLYTGDANEYQTLSGMPDWNGEGVAWYSPTIGIPMVIRLYNKTTGFHLYTADTNEIQKLMYPCDSPWEYDNKVGNYIYPVFYSGGSKEIYRLYHPGIRAHLLTADAGEYNTLTQNGWNGEGAAFYAIR